MYEDENVVDATQVQVVDAPQDQSPVVTETAPTVEPTGVKDVAPAEQQDKTEQDPALNAKFAEVRRRAEAEARDKLIAEQYGQYGITNYADYLKAKAAEEARVAEEEARAKATEDGKDPQLYVEMLNAQKENQTLRERLDALERKENYAKEEAEIMKDPVRGELFKMWERDIKDIATSANVALKTAFTLMVEEKLPELLQGAKKTTEQETIKKIISNEQTSTGSASGGQSVKPSLDKMSSKEFEEYAKRVERGEIRSL